MATRPKLVEWNVSEDTAFKTEVDNISLVDDPAIEVGFTMLSSQKSTQKIDRFNPDQRVLQKMIDESVLLFEPDTSVMQRLKGQKLLATPIMIANKPILRFGVDWDAAEQIDWDLPDDELEQEIEEKVLYEYHGYWTEPTVRSSAYQFSQKSYQKNWNVMHQPYLGAKGVYLAESWIVEDPYADKSNSFGYAVNPGSWFGLVKVDNQALYDEHIASGYLSGVSVEVWQEESIKETYGAENGTPQKLKIQTHKADFIRKVYLKKTKPKNPLT